MKIVHIVGYFVTELGYQEYYLAKEHKKQGHDVYVITSDLLYPFPDIENMLKEAGIKNTSRKREPGYSVVDGIKVYRLPHYLEFVDLVLVKGMKKVLQKIKPDVVFAHESRQGTCLKAAKLKKKLNYKLIVDQHDFFHKIPNHPIIKRILRFLDYNIVRKRIVNYCFRKADKIVPVTKETKDFLIKRHRVPEEKLALIPLGVNMDFFKYDERRREDVRKKYRIKKDEIVIIFAGTIVRRKGIEILIEAFSELDNIKSKLVIAGSGDKEYMKELKQKVSKLNIDSRVVFTGFLNKKDLKDFFNSSDIGIWPGNNSVIIMEAMSCKLPIIMVDLQLSHLVGYNNGFKFQEKNKEELKKHMHKLIQNLKLRKEMGENSAKAILNNYSYKEISKRFIDLAKQD